MHVIYQNHKWICHKKKEAKQVQPVQMNIYQSNTYIENT